ncbi:MAG: response regulator [Longimicrobiales bacterium]|nr:response regulator [Longimicrobiales bacterium]
MTPPAFSRPSARVLVVEDDPEIRYLLSQVLADEGREVLVAATAADGERLLSEEEVHLMVLDLLLPDADGRNLLGALRARSSTAALPVIVLTSRASPELRTECYELGADSFVEKPFDPELLAADVSSRLERAAARKRQSQHDDLTGLLNFAGLLESIEVLGGQPRAVVMLGLDGLRSVYDRFGWATAEMYVCEVGKALARALPGAALARPSGGEFGVALATSREDEAATVASTFVETVRRVPLNGPDRETFRLTASAGFSLDAGSGDASELVEAARVLVEGVQEEGGNRVATPGGAQKSAAAAPLVLVAEDDDITAKILTHRLQKDALQVLLFANGEDAYRAALDKTPALVILDVKMPGMDGFEVLERLRMTPSYATIPIMMLTSMGSEADVVRGFELGADDYMLKPFAPTELLARLRRLLRRGRRTA